MNVAKWLMLAVLAIPLAELAAFVAVAAAVGFAWALALLLGGSLAGALILRHAGGSHIARVRVAMSQGLGEGTYTALQADSSGVLILLAGILLLIPGFITDIAGLLLLVAPLRRALAGWLGVGAPPRQRDGIVDLEPEQWRRVPDPALPHRGDKDEGR